MKRVLLITTLLVSSFASFAQNEEEEKRSFKENLFTGGSVSLAFYNNSFLIGASPVFGYSLTNWADAGIVVNYNYSSYKNQYAYGDKLHQQVYGGGGFVKLYPVRFIFLQAQAERNYARLKYFPALGDVVQKQKGEANSFLVGAGYCTGREGRGGSPHYYLSVLFDIGKDELSPYVDQDSKPIPIVRAGIQFPLFQGSKHRDD